MKKFIVLFISILTYNFTFGQNIAEKRKLTDGALSYEDVLKTDSMLSARKIYGRALLFVANKFHFANDNIRLKDEINNVIVARGTFNNIKIKALIGKSPGYIEFTIAIYCKDGKYKYVIDQMHWYSENCENTQMELIKCGHLAVDVLAKSSADSSLKDMEAIDEKIKKFVDELNQYINKTKEDW